MLGTMFTRVLAQSFPGGGSNGGTAPVSPSVLATEMSIVDADGRGRLELLILWRGSPGWFQKRRRRQRWRIHGGRAEPDDSQRVDFARWCKSHRAVRSCRARKVWIQDSEIALDDANVVLVDGVDSPAGPQVVRTLRIDPDA